MYTKGGVGKSTISVHLAAAFASANKTLLIDTDAQQTAAKWASWRRENNQDDSLTTITLQGSAAAKEGVALARDYATVIIDAGGGNQPGLRAALAIAQLAIIPVGASEFDTAAMNDFIEVLELAKPLNPTLTVCALLNRVARTKETREVERFLTLAAMPMFTTHIHERVAYRRATALGKSVQELTIDQKATLEMNRLIKEIQTKIANF